MYHKKISTMVIDIDTIPFKILYLFEFPLLFVISNKVVFLLW